MVTGPIWIVGIGLVLVLAGCSASGPQPEFTTVPTSEAPSGSTTATGIVSVNELEATADPLPAGTYIRTSFEPPITITLDDGWRAVQLFDGFFDVQQRVGTPDVIAIQFARPLGIVGADGDDLPQSSEAAVERVRTNPGLSVVESSSSLIGGLSGHQITVENSGAGHASILEVSVGQLGIDPARRLWMAFFDTDAGLLAIMVGGATDSWDEALATAEPVLESIRLGG